MQRATGQYDHLARIPRTGPRQSRGRRSFASRHWCRAASRRSRGMEPTVRNPRIESAIGSEAARSSHLRRRFPKRRPVSSVRNSVAGNGIFGCRDRRPKIHPSDRYCRQRPGTLKIGDKIPAETTSFRSTTVSAVREDWMVADAVQRNRSPKQEQGIFRKLQAKTGFRRLLAVGDWKFRCDPKQLQHRLGTFLLFRKTGG